jgi:cytochrome d ubiquinol oxidase subunit II
VLTVQQAAAPRDTLVLVIVAVIGGGLILFPSLALLLASFFTADSISQGGGLQRAFYRGGYCRRRLGVLGRAACACLVAGSGLLTVADAGWAHVPGIVSLLVFIALGFLASQPDQIALHAAPDPRRSLEEDDAAG